MAGANAYGFTILTETEGNKNLKFDDASVVLANTTVGCR
jgi:hypothetical protein